MSNEELIERRKQAMGPAYSHFYKEPLYLTRGEGVWLFDNEGRKYLDCYNNVPSVGHCHPYVVDADDNPDWHLEYTYSLPASFDRRVRRDARRHAAR